MTFEEWVVAANRYSLNHPEQRIGQAYFNSLYEYKPGLANDLIATDFDPFYDNAKIEVFLNHVGENW